MSIAKEINNRLLAAGIASKKRWWERYLKHSLKFYGADMAQIRSIAQSSWDQSDQKDFQTIDELFRIQVAEPKLAAIALLETRYLDEITLEHLNSIAVLFDEGYISDWHITDWLCTKVLSKLIKKTEFYDHLVRWVDGKTIWQRRCPCVMLVPNATKATPSKAQEYLRIAKSSLGETRFEQTGVAWLLSELGKRYPELVLEFLKEYDSILLKETKQRSLKHINKKLK